MEFLRQEAIMTAAFYDEVAAVAPAPTLRVVRDTDTIAAPAPKTRRGSGAPFGAGGDPLVDGAARLLSIPLRHVYAALWRVGVLEVQA
ncbi:hypothetical protein O979_15590 [Mycobacterium avium subsp. paratuberculosis 10-4404]|nr:hypothetical protein D522_08333 [Mycobacterium avium subsp. paratuberculosis S5]ETB00281.1 hypothetical protein O979_15590 [Mycobacterium avium subsp. paratuberculosis 10-4404]ETB03061.1 hypothetical protein O978_14210 [Mycobacterium avium subsp. paratuberculosis 10-5864]ETB10928.1 hypothetical protein O980_13885 [Mycobacterium avium subsp. paratuberculosis 08-8281]